MSWKPSRSSCILFDRYTRNAAKHKASIDELLPHNNPPKFSDINKLSKHFYLWYLNDNKAGKDLTGSSKYWHSFDKYCDNYFITVFKRYPEYTYKPLQKLLT